MSRTGFVLRRFAWALVITWFVLTLTFVVVAAPPDPNVAAYGFAVALSGGDAQAAMEAYREARGLDKPLVARYVTFIVDLLTLQWGTSFSYGVPVVELVGERGLVTAAYLLPAMAISTVGGVVVGLWTTVREDGILDRLTVGTSYAGFGIPAFWIGLVLVALFGEALGFTGGLNAGFDAGTDFHMPGDLLDRQNLTFMIFPTTAMALTLFAAQVRYVRSETREYLREDFVKLLRSSGAGRLIVARHVLRNAALPLISVLFTELLGALLVSVFVVEAALDVPGLGVLAYEAVEQRDVPVVVTSMLLPIMVGVFGNFAQDLAYALLDPRVEME